MIFGFIFRSVLIVWKGFTSFSRLSVFRRYCFRFLIRVSGVESGVGGSVSGFVYVVVTFCRFREFGRVLRVERGRFGLVVEFGAL